MKIRFVVLGDPVGAVRTTQRAKWTNKGYARYCAYKDAIRWACKMQCKVGESELSDVPGKTLISVMIYFRTKRRPDPDNVWKGVADALFGKDKWCVGEFDYQYDKTKPRIEVRIVSGSDLLDPDTEGRFLKFADVR